MKLTRHSLKGVILKLREAHWQQNQNMLSTAIASIKKKITLSQTSKAPRYFNISLSLKIGFALVLLFTAFGNACLSYARMIRSGGDSWLAGDWLINYSGGFVRRGLFGEIFRTIFPNGQLGLWYLFIFQSCLYALMLFYFVRYLMKEKFSWVSIALICNPAAFAFVGWDTRAFARKESLGFVSLIVIAMAAQRVSNFSKSLKYLGVFCFIASIFMSEINAIMLPSVVYLLANSFRSGQHKARSIIEVSLISLTSLIALALTLVSPGTILQREIICGSLQEIGLNKELLCGGAISSIGATYREVQKILIEDLFPQYLGYLPLLVIATIPIFLTSWFRKNRFWVLFIFLFSAPLYSAVWDYGRLIHIFIIQITILVISKGTEEKTHYAWNPLSVILFVTLWGVPHYGYIAWGTNSALRLLESLFY